MGQFGELSMVYPEPYPEPRCMIPKGYGRPGELLRFFVSNVVGDPGVQHLGPREWWAEPLFIQLTHDSPHLPIIFATPVG